MFDFPSLYQAYQACRRGKRASHNTQRYEVHLLDHLVSTSEALQSHRWLPARSVSFVCARPKAREIHAADFADRVVHHLLVPRLEALYEPLFIHDSYSNRQGKGTHAAVARLQSFMRKVSRNGKQRAYFLQLDIRNFFNCIDRRVLLGLLLARLDKSLAQQKIGAHAHDEMGWLCGVLLKENAACDAIRRGSPSSFNTVPLYKQLIHAPEGCGIAIGNLSSQFFANVYLNELDQFVKHDLKCRYYLRYVDDFVLLHESEAQLAQWCMQIQQFLHAKLGLELKALNDPTPVSSGCDFLGYVTRSHYKLVRRRAVHHCAESLLQIEKLILRKQCGGTAMLIRQEHRERLRASLCSYFGHFLHASSFKLEQNIFARFAWLKLLFNLRIVDADQRGLLPLWQPQQVNSFRGQWLWFHYHFPGVVQLIQLGRSYVCADTDLHRLPESVRKMMRTGKTITGFAAMRLAPLHALKSVRAQLRKAQMAHLFVAEEGYLRGGMKRRVLRLIWKPECRSLAVPT